MCTRVRTIAGLDTMEFCRFCDFRPGCVCLLGKVAPRVRAEGHDCARGGRGHFGPCTRVIRAAVASGRFSVPLAPGSWPNGGQGQLPDPAATAEITCKSMTLRWSCDCLLPCSLLFVKNSGEGAVWVFWRLPLWLPTCLPFLYFCPKTA